MASESAGAIPSASSSTKPLRSLHLNEAPFSPAAKVLWAMQKAAVDLNRYPDHEGRRLCEALSMLNGVGAERIVVGAGSNELLFASAAVALEPGCEVVAPSPSFPTYATGAALAGASYVGVPLMVDGLVDVDAILSSITSQTRLVYVSSPHNPTGGMLSQERLDHLIRHMPTSVLLHLDEAYYEFGRHAGGPETLPLLEQCKGPWISTRSFSKAYGLAGARVGYGIAQDKTLAEVYRGVRPAYSVNAVALAGALAALEEKEYLAHLLEHNAYQRARLAAALMPLGFIPLPSAANFLTVITPVPAQALASALRAQNVLILAMLWPGAPGALRITIGSADDTAAVIEELVAALQSLGVNSPPLGA